MRTVNRNINLYGSICNSTLLQFNQDDKKEWKILWDSWNNLRVGLKGYDSRGPNLSEGLSESAFCLYSHSLKIMNILVIPHYLLNLKFIKIKRVCLYRFQKSI